VQSLVLGWYGLCTIWWWRVVSPPDSAFYGSAGSPQRRALQRCTRLAASVTPSRNSRQQALEALNGARCECIAYVKQRLRRTGVV
jgi:hypothetical protein